MGETRADPATPGDREARLTTAAAALRDAVAPRLREMVKRRAHRPAKITRQAGLLVQTHFRNNGVLLAPLELRDYVAEVLRPVLPATTFSAPAPPAEEPPTADVASGQAVPAVAVPDPSPRPQVLPAAAVPPPVEPAKPDVADESSKLSRAKFLNICNRIVSRIGRRVDESSPICDARLLDGSRVNIMIPPLAIDGASVSIRKFGKRQIGFDQMAQQGNISPAMATLLRLAARCRLNVVVSAAPVRARRPC